MTKLGGKLTLNGDTYLSTGESTFRKWISPSSLITVVIAIVGLIWWVSIQSGAIYANAVALQKLEASIFSLNTPLSTKVLVNEEKTSELIKQLDALATTNKVLVEKMSNLDRDLAIVREQVRLLSNELAGRQR